MDTLIRHLQEGSDIVSGLEADLDNRGDGDLYEVRDWWREADSMVAEAGDAPSPSLLDRVSHHLGASASVVALLTDACNTMGFRGNLDEILQWQKDAQALTC